MGPIGIPSHIHTRTMAEQNASVYGKGATKSMMSKDVDVAAPDTFPPRFTSKPDTPMERLVCVLQEAMDVAGGMDPALRANTSPDSAECAELRNKTCTAPWSQLWDEGKTMFPFSDVWSTDVVEGQTLKNVLRNVQGKARAGGGHVHWVWRSLHGRGSAFRW